MSAVKQFKHKHATVFTVIREIEIWWVAMLMVNRYADGSGRLRADSATSRPMASLGTSAKA
jgi:hypothetical protein